NGNIGSVVWKAHGESKKGYGYAYDGLNRLKKADFEVNVSTNVWSSGNNFDVTGGAPKGIDYDIRGNIKSLKRYGNSSSYENDLVYTYSGNQLVSIKDNAKGINGSYSYDTNGNMTKDGYRGFDVTYNRMNLPKQVSKGNDVIDYFYTADGTKVMKQTTKGGNTTRVSYAGSFVYQGDELDYIITSEGMWKSEGYQYNLKDHLGNVRVVINQGGTLISKSDYYPFGKLHDRQSVDFVKNKYLYNGKEIQDEELDGVLLDWYDYGARFYDAELGRWHVIDNKAEKYFGYSPYTYCINNPIRVIDPDGNDIIVLAAQNSVGGYGHSAVLIGNDKTGWNLYSKNGTTWSKGAIGPSNKHPESGVQFESLSEFANSESNFDHDTGDVLYTEGYRIEADDEVDAVMEDAAQESVESYYNVLTNSCIDVTSDALEAGGFDPGNGTLNTKSPIPNNRYEKIKKNNKGKVISNGLKPNKKTASKQKQKAAKRKEKAKKEKQKRANQWVNNNLDKIKNSSSNTK
ncbi:RHS repeat-associated core domain-containing protein, partial [Puteibacter caeruleilacunae]